MHAIQNLCLMMTLATIAPSWGCSSDRPNMAPVSGRVLIDGQPLRHGTVQFLPKGSCIVWNAGRRGTISPHLP